MTIECYDKTQKSSWSSWHLCESKNYWILIGSTVYHRGRQRKVQCNTQHLKVGETIGCSVHKDGTLHYYVNGIDSGVSWDDKLPTNQTMYGVVDIYGRHKKIRSLFHYGKYANMNIT